MDQIQPRSVNHDGQVDKKQPRKRAKKEKKSRAKDDPDKQKDSPLKPKEEQQKPEEKQVEKRKRKKKGNEEQQEQKPKEKSKQKGGKSKRAKCGENEVEVVAQYMLKQNRPYSLINIFDNLHGQIKKAVLEGVLQELCSEKKGTLIQKNYNKFIIYFYNQNLLEKPSQQQLKRMNLTFTSVSQKLRELNALLAKTLSRPSLSALKSQLEETRLQVQRKQSKLQFYHSKQFVPADSKEVQRVNKLVQKKEKALKQRRGGVLSGLSSLAEGMERKSRQLGEEIGLDFQQPN